MTQALSGPLVSVIMIARNAAQTLPLALNSLRQQSYQNWECILVDDASEDDTIAGLRATTLDPRVVVLRFPEQRGRGPARAEALKHCRGKYICSLDADDFFFRHTLALQVERLEEQPLVAAVVGRLLLFQGQGEPRLLGTLRGSPKPGLHLVSRQPQALRFPFGAIIFRREIVGQHTFENPWKYSEDRDFFSRVLGGQKVQVLSPFTYAYRWNFQAEKVLLGLRESEQQYGLRFSLYPLRSLRLMLLTRLKIIVYSFLLRLGLWDWVDRLRVVSPTDCEMAFFSNELESLSVRQE